MDQYIGKRMGNYDIVELIGKGGMAAVYRGHQPSMNRSVAIKIMASQFSSDPSFVARFKNEANLIAQLEHAHILPVYDFGEQDGVLYIVMRYLSAGTLDDRIPEGGMKIKEAVGLFRQLAAALDYAHQRGVIHRDLKPSNVMVDAQGNAFLTDFGIAKSLDSDSKLTGTGGVVGTPTYMSPEQGLGEPLDKRSDIYALGVILFEMLTGRPPFTAENPMAVMLKHINEPPPAPSSFNPAITPAVEAVIIRALAKEPSVRFETAMQMAEAFDEAVKTDTVPMQAAAFTTPEATLRVSAAPTPAPATAPGADAALAGPTLRSPVAGQPATPTSLPAAQVGAPAVTAPGMPVYAPPAAAIPAAIPAPVPGQPERVPVDLNAPSVWLNEHQGLGQWLQAVMLTGATFVLLSRLTTSAALGEIALLSIIPGVIYALLRNPTLAGLISYVLILVPLAARAPGLALLWTLLFIVAASRLNSREIMLTLVTIALASNPIGWIIPLLAPWWIKVRRVALPMALGVLFATLFALTLGWPNAGGLLPVPPDLDPAETRASMTLGEFDTTYLGLLEPATWSVISENPQRALDAIRSTFLVTGGAVARSGGLILVLAAIWALASVLSVSNRRSANPMFRATGVGFGLIILIVGHLILAQSMGTDPSPGAVVAGLLGAALAFILSQWPIQADPNAGNLPGTVMRMLRQSMGAVFMALGVAFFMQYVRGDLDNSPLFPVLWLGGMAGTLTMIVNPMIGPPIVYASLAVALAAISPLLAGLVGVLFFGYLVVNLAFDRRRPRQWNPLGAGFMLGAPGMSVTGMLPLGPLSLGALEAQVPAAIMAAMGHVLLIGTAENYRPVALLIQLVTTLTGVLLVERLMGSPLLDTLDHKLRRLLFTVVLAALMAVSYFGLGRVETTIADPAPLGLALLVSMVSAAALVIGMGDRARYWRTFIEKEEEEPEAIDEELTTGSARKAAAR